MPDENKATPAPQGPLTFERIEKAGESVRGSAFAEAKPINAAPAVPTEIPQALLGTPQPPVSDPARDNS